MLHGLFFEDINYAADGGLYAELVENRSFEHRDSLYSWSEAPRGGTGAIQVASEKPLNDANARYLRVQVRSVTGEGFGVRNDGFGGIPVQEGEKLQFSVHARRDKAFNGELIALLEDEQGRQIGRSRIRGVGPEWKRFHGTIRATGSTANARLLLLATAPGRVDLDMVSLFPEKTWKGRRNGMRADLGQKLAAMRPGFLRFPGGCIVEGRDLENAYRWKDTIGDIATRRQNWNLWADPSRRDSTAHYHQTYGLGYFEYFQLCEDLGAEPVPVVNCGMACQARSTEVVPLDQLGPWVQDALDLIEFANGPVTSTWGAKRAAMGHPKPFRMKYLGIGNEQWGEAYFERYKIFYDAIKAKYPEIQLITTSGPGVDDELWRVAWSRFKSGTPAEIVDEHYYRAPQWFLQQTERYDSYDRKGPKVFAGEYAAHVPGRRNTLGTALAEAAYMTGLVRNADIVHMASYAPLLARAGFTQWAPDLIWFDGARAYGTPSYHVQALFSQHRGDVVLPTEVETPRVAETYAGRIGVGTWSTQAEFKDIRVTRGGQTLFESDFTRGTAGWTLSRGKWTAAGGALHQAGGETNVRAMAGDPSWSDYTLSLKARKLGGREGFLIHFQSLGEEATAVWNLGGWDNKQHGVEGPGITLTRVPGSIETGRWYDIRVELSGGTIRCYLDGRLVQEVKREAPRALYAVTSRENRTGEIIVKVVNPTAQPVETAVRLQGVEQIAREGAAVVLTAAGPEAENSLEQPEQVTPQGSTLRNLSTEFAHRFPAHSLTVLRLRPGRSAR